MDEVEENQEAVERWVSWLQAWDDYYSDLPTNEEFDNVSPEGEPPPRTEN